MEHHSPWYEISSSLQIDIIGYIKTKNRHPTRIDQPYWILVFVEKGSRTLIAGNRALRVDAHEFFLLPPHTSQYPSLIDDHAAFYVHFYAHGAPTAPPTQPDASRLCLPMSGQLPDEPDCFSLLHYLYEHSLSQFSDPDFTASLIRSLLSIISLHCQQHPATEGKKEQFIESCLTFIREHACRTLRASDYEAALGLSYHQINVNFKNIFGCTVKQYHRHICMKHAAQMLRDGISLQQTAEQCGFDDYYYFIKTFKQEYGITPQTYQNMHGITVELQ